MLPGEDPAEDEYYLRERYLGDAASQPPSLYYKVKPLVPRRAQMALRRRAWPAPFNL